MAAPLEGIKILDFSIAVAAPFGGFMLADMGAEVIKIERIQGEPQRLGLPAGMDDVLDTKIAEGAVDTTGWIALNRGKKDLAIDVRTDKGREIVLKLARDADVILQSFRPGVADRLGIGYEAISKINPKVIYCSFSGYGQTGPTAHRAGGDMWSQAMSGMISVMGYPDGPPQMVTFAPVDNTSGMLIAYAIMTALFVRERTGVGQEVMVNNLDAALYLQFTGFAGYLTDGRVPQKQGRSYGSAPPFGPFKARDGDVLTIFGTDPMWPEFCKLLGVEYLAHDPRFENDEVRRKHRDEIEPLLDEAFSKKTRAEWQQIFRDAKMRCDPCLTYDEICSHPQMEANEMIFTTNHPARGKVGMLGVPVKLSKTQGHPQGPSPLLGEHTEEILLGLGYTAEDITKLEDEKVIRAVRKKAKD
jgi:crotonobetainyl-CoA:carnitine CoA-transferase CaiB-like acyl-CoA transferase